MDKDKNKIKWLKSHASDNRLTRIIDDKIDIIVYPDGFIDNSYRANDYANCVMKKWNPATQKDIDDVISVIQSKINDLQNGIRILSNFPL